MSMTPLWLVLWRSPLLRAAAGIPGLRIALHAGGLWLGARRQPMGQALRDHVRPHDERITP